LINEDKEKESIQDFNLVMDSYAAHAQAPSISAGDDDDEQDDVTTTSSPPSATEPPAPPPAVEDLQSRVARGSVVSMPRLPGALADRVRVLR
jgi:hypothetical protein